MTAGDTAYNTALKLSGVNRGLLLRHSDGRTQEPTPELALDRPANSGDLCFMNAMELAALIRACKVSPRDVMAAHLERIDRLNPKINAIVAKLDDDRCLELADAMGSYHGISVPVTVDSTGQRSIATDTPATGYGVFLPGMPLRWHSASSRKPMNPGRRAVPPSALGVLPRT